MVTVAAGHTGTASTGTTSDFPTAAATDTYPLRAKICPAAYKESSFAF